MQKTPSSCVDRWSTVVMMCRSRPYGRAVVDHVGCQIFQDISFVLYGMIEPNSPYRSNEHIGNSRCASGTTIPCRGCCTCTHGSCRRHQRTWPCPSWCRRHRFRSWLREWCWRRACPWLILLAELRLYAWLGLPTDS